MIFTKTHVNDDIKRRRPQNALRDLTSSLQDAWHTLPAFLNLASRMAMVVLICVLSVLIVFAGAKHALAANLKPISIIQGDILTAGDLFDGLRDEKAAFVLGPAPQPGEDMTLTAVTLMRVARALDLPWQPSSAADQITVRRAATVIDTNAIEHSLIKALKSEGIREQVRLAFHGMTAPRFILPPNVRADLKVESLSFDPVADHFAAVLRADSHEGHPLQSLNISGSVERLVEIPVLRQTVRRGEIIGPTDIETIMVSDRDVQHDLVLTAQDMIGMTPRRVLNAGKPVRDNELESPQIVGRGDMITLIYEQGPLLLTAKGKALQNGAKGDLIQVVNLSSSRPIEGMITAQREVKVLN